MFRVIIICIICLCTKISFSQITNYSVSLNIGEPVGVSFEKRIRNKFQLGVSLGYHELFHKYDYTSKYNKEFRLWGRSGINSLSEYFKLPVSIYKNKAGVFILGGLQQRYIPRVEYTWIPPTNGNGYLNGDYNIRHKLEIGCLFYVGIYFIPIRKLIVSAQLGYYIELLRIPGWLNPQGAISIGYNFNKLPKIYSKKQQ